MMKRTLLTLSLAFCLSSNLSAQQSNVINTAVPFLRVTPDARAAGMGNVGVATSPDAHSIFWNTSKLAFIQNQFGISGSYNPFSQVEPRGVYLLDASAYWRIDSLQAITASFRYYHVGELIFTNSSGIVLSIVKPVEYTAHLGYARKLTSEFSTGINLGYVRSNFAKEFSLNNIPIKPGNSVMADLSFFFTHPVRFESVFRKYNLGVAISNLGNKMAYTDSIKNFLPANLGIGADFDFQFWKRHQLSFALDLNKLLVATSGALTEKIREVDISAGTEYWYNKMIAIRTGLFYESKTSGARQFFNLGAALKYQIIQMDVAYFINISPYQNPWANSLQFGLSLDLNFHKNQTAKKS